MGQKFNITETERNQIRGLYEQQSNLGISDSEYKLLQDEKRDPHHDFVMDIDDFDGTMTLTKSSMDNSYKGHIMITKKMDNVVVQPSYFMGVSYEKKGLFQSNGVQILFQDNSQWSKLNQPVKVDAGSNGYSYSATFVLNDQDLKIFSTKKIKIIRLSRSVDYQLDDTQSSDVSNAINLMFKINQKNFKPIYQKIKNENQSKDQPSDVGVKDYPPGDKGISEFFAMVFKIAGVEPGNYKVKVKGIVKSNGEFSNGSLEDLSTNKIDPNKLKNIEMTVFKNLFEWVPVVKNGVKIDSNVDKQIDVVIK